MTVFNIFKIVGVIIAIAVMLMMILAYCGFSLTDIITMFSAMVVAVSAAATAFFAYKGASYAYKGLSIWREQHGGKIESDLATRLLVSIYKYREEVEDYTIPFINPDLILPVYAPNLSEIYQPLQAREKFHDESCGKMDSARQEIYVDIFKSKALWGGKILLIFREINVEASQIKQKVYAQIYEAYKKIADKKLTTKQEVEQFFDEIKLDKAVADKFNEKVLEAEEYLKSKILTATHKPTNTKKGKK